MAEQKDKDESLNRAQRRRMNRQQSRRQNYVYNYLPRILLGVGALVVIVVIVTLVRPAILPRTGEAVPFSLEPAEHIPDGAIDLENYTNPPTSGPHYAQPIPPGFYSDPIDPGYLIHSLEHGYVVIWYNCALLPEGEDCDTLESQISDLVDDDGGKLIGVPYDLLEVPVAASTWGRLLHLDAFDRSALQRFITTNRSKDAPEPNAR